MNSGDASMVIYMLPIRRWSLSYYSVIEEKGDKSGYIFEFNIYNEGQDIEHNISYYVDVTYKLLDDGYQITISNDIIKRLDIIISIDERSVNFETIEGVEYINIRHN